MNDFFSNKYTRLAMLTLGLALLFYLIIWMIMSIVQVAFLPPFLHLMVSVLGAAILVAKYFAFRIA